MTGIDKRWSDMLGRMKKAFEKKRGMRLTWDDLHLLNISIIGEHWELPEADDAEEEEGRHSAFPSS